MKDLALLTGNAQLEWTAVWALWRCISTLTMLKPLKRHPIEVVSVRLTKTFTAAQRVRAGCPLAQRVIPLLQRNYRL